jgi:hypothetical protein
MKDYKYAVVTTYSWETGEPVVELFDDYDNAVAHLRKTAEQEHKIDVEENGWDSELIKHNEGHYELIVYTKSGEEDRTNFMLTGSVYK